MSKLHAAVYVRMQLNRSVVNIKNGLTEYLGRIQFFQKNKHYSPQNLQFYKLLKDKLSINSCVSN